MQSFELSQAARTDLDSIADFTAAQWGRQQARTYLQCLRERLAHLAQQPSIGRTRSDLAPDLLSFPCESHVIYYKVTKLGIVVVRILHARQDPIRHIQ